LEILERVLTRLRRRFEAAGTLQQFERLSAYLTGEGPRLAYRELAAELDMSENAVKVAVHRLRRRFGEVLREEIAQTLADQSDVDEEARYLLTVIARRTPGRP
jgi:RNA polymerase sigma-70 factor (ECF subfamily)